MPGNVILANFPDDTDLNMEDILEASKKKN